MKLAVAFFAVAASAFAQARSPESTVAAPTTYGESPRNMVAEVSLGPYYPFIDRAFHNVPVGPYESTFGKSSMLLGRIEVERQLFQRLGSLAVGLSAGYMEKYGRGVDDLGNELADEAVSLKIVPMDALVVY